MTQNNAYTQCIKAMFGLRRFGIKLGLSTIRDILKGLGNPQDRFKCIHVAGTNGKGSIASALASVLKISGYKVGLYTSPHLVRFNERICINGAPIDDENVVESYEAVKDVHHGTREPTFFEYTTAMALYEFAREKVDWAVVETGMGGRLDATNIIKPAVSVISNISLEHRTYLGNTIAEIAGEKGGIIKNNTPVVTGVKQKSATATLKKIAVQKGAPFYRLGDEFRVRRNKKGTFTYFGIENVWRDMQTGLLGNFQIDNAALVLAACEILNPLLSNQGGTELSLSSIRQGLADNQWPGRLEKVSTSPYILIDGAHNLIAARNLAGFLSENTADRRLTLVTGMLDDKPYDAMLKALVPHCTRVILTRPRIDRSLDPKILLPIAKKLNPDVTIIPKVGDAVRTAIETASPDDAICIAGSLYVVGEAKEAIEKGALNSAYKPSGSTPFQT